MRKKHSQEISKMVEKYIGQPITREHVANDIRIRANMLKSSLLEATAVDELNKRVAFMDSLELIELLLKFCEMKTGIEEFIALLENRR